MRYDRLSKALENENIQKFKTDVRRNLAALHNQKKTLGVKLEDKDKVQRQFSTMGQKVNFVRIRNIQFVKPRNWIIDEFFYSAYCVDAQLPSSKDNTQEKFKWYVDSNEMFKSKFSKTKENNKDLLSKLKSKYDDSKGDYKKKFDDLNKPLVPVLGFMLSMVYLKDDEKGSSDNSTYQGRSLKPQKLQGDSDCCKKENESQEFSSVDELAMKIKALENQMQAVLEKEQAIKEKQKIDDNGKNIYKKTNKKLDWKLKNANENNEMDKDEKNSKRNTKEALIDMYSEVLDYLSDYDKGYSTLDLLPRVVVVGDQSAGKTSVLEMIAQARVFPRGAGEMMTRSPVKVTLSKGPNHIAQFKDGTRKFDLTKESDLKDLRKEIELKMNSFCSGEKTVSSEAISLSVKGPNLRRMVLVDLPGMINTVTHGMAQDTKESILEMVQQQMKNPNSIILCVQDGSVDAELSLVTDTVNKVDPEGKRTIFVLTKADKAELETNKPVTCNDIGIRNAMIIVKGRIQKILNGKLLPMKALGYFAVVTGMPNGDDQQIDKIKEYEAEFFKNSSLFGNLSRHGILEKSQLTTANLSVCVSDCFWKMVKESVEQQADIFETQRINLETEWEVKYKNYREMDRDEMFERARHKILDDMHRLVNITPQELKNKLQDNLWEAVSDPFINQVYLPAAKENDRSKFETQVDIKLSDWSRKLLPEIVMKVAKQTLIAEFVEILSNNTQAVIKGDDFSKLKEAVCDVIVRRHAWNDQFLEPLKVIIDSALQDKQVRGGKEGFEEWKEAAGLMKRNLIQVKKEVEGEMTRTIGPNWVARWTKWEKRSEIQQRNLAVKHQLEQMCPRGGSKELSQVQLSTIMTNLLLKGFKTVEEEDVTDMWQLLSRTRLLEDCLQNCSECRTDFFRHTVEGEELIEWVDDAIEDWPDCNSVILWWRMSRTLEEASKALRQQLVKEEAKRLETEVRDLLGEISKSSEMKEELLDGERVKLADEIRKVRQILDKLHIFIGALKKEPE